MVKFSSSSSSSQRAEPLNHHHNDSEIMDEQFEGDDPSFPIAKGGPIYIANMVNSSITSVTLFQQRLLYQVKILQAELSQHSSSSSSTSHDDDDISYVYYAHSFSLYMIYLHSHYFIHSFYSVDDLKLFTQDELMDMAFKQAFQVCMLFSIFYS